MYIFSINYNSLFNTDKLNNDSDDDRINTSNIYFCVNLPYLNGII